MSEMNAEYVATVMLNKFRQGIVELLNEVIKASEDGSISGWEGFMLAQKAAMIGTELYAMSKQIPSEIVKAVPGTLMRVEFKLPEVNEGFNF